MINEVLADADERMGKTVEAFRADLRKIRTGRASPSLIDQLMVDYYGSPTPLLQIATISAADAQLLTVRPFSPTDIQAIEKAVLTADIGLNPSNDGQLIRLPIPALTEERRRELTKQMSKRTEEARVSVRNIRREANNDLRDMEKENMVSEDEYHRGQEQVQKKTDDFIKKVDEIAKNKEKEIMTI